MKIILILLVITFSSIQLQSQMLDFVPPNYVLIEKNISNPESKFYYPKLFERLKNFDSTLKREEYVHLYYGYSFQERYRPYWRNPYTDTLMSYSKRNDISNEEYQILIVNLLDALDQFPFDLNSLSFLAHYYKEIGDEEKHSIVKKQMISLIDLIFFTGNGTECNTAFHVISVSHEYFLLEVLGLEFKGQSLLSESLCDAMRARHPTTGDEITIFFNVSRLFASKNKF